jgi:uroporphyrinogen decarboxylase
MRVNARERFNRIMHYQNVDRPPVWGVEGVAEGAVRRWIRDGTFPEGMVIADVLPLDGHESVILDTDPLPAFVSRTIEDSERWKTTTDEYGFTVRTLKEQSVTPRIYYYTAGSVSNHSDWERLAVRYDPSDMRRKPRTWGPDLWDHLNGSPSPVSMRIDWGPGRGAKNGYAMGLQPFLETLMDDPGFAREMMDFWADFVIAVARDWFDHVHFDFVFINEDGMGYKNSTLVSPKMYTAIWLPAMRKVVDFLHSHGVDIIAYYSSGDLRPLMPTLLDIGINLHFPLEVAAGMDAPELRRTFGRAIRLIGNIARQALMDGPAAVDEEFQRKVPALMADGGYIPAADDIITPDMTFESYRHYIELVRNYRL